MFAQINAKTFRIDTVVPALQTAAVLVANEVMGSLGKYSVTIRSAAIIGSVASLATAVAQNFFSNPVVRYASTGLGVLAGVAAHNFLYPALPTIDPIGAIVIGSVIVAVRFAANQLDPKVNPELFVEAHPRNVDVTAQV